MDTATNKFVQSNLQQTILFYILYLIKGCTFLLLHKSMRPKYLDSLATSDTAMKVSRQLGNSPENLEGF